MWAISFVCQVTCSAISQTARKSPQNFPRRSTLDLHGLFLQSSAEAFSPNEGSRKHVACNCRHCALSDTYSITCKTQGFGIFRRNLARVLWPVRDAYSAQAFKEPALGRLKIDFSKHECHFPCALQCVHRLLRHLHTKHPFPLKQHFVHKAVSHSKT